MTQGYPGDTSFLALAVRKKWSSGQFFMRLEASAMSNPYRYPETGHVYRCCVMCGRPFRVCKSALARRSARFCTVRCYHAALRAFREALATDRLGLILDRPPTWDGCKSQRLTHKAQELRHNGS